MTGAPTARAQTRRQPLPYHAIGAVGNALAGLEAIKRLALDGERALDERNTRRALENFLRIRAEALEAQDALKEIRR